MRGKPNHSFRNLLIVGLLGLFGLFVLLPAPQAAPFPREGNPDIANGIADPFVGHWWIGFPEGEGMINGAPVVDCANPVRLSAIGAQDLLYQSPKGEDVRFELMEFSGRTTLFTPMGESIIAVWIDADAFLAYSVDITTGRARWDNPLAYRRCPQAAS